MSHHQRDEQGQAQPPQDVSDYEARRLENIRRNKAFLEQAGLASQPHPAFQDSAKPVQSATKRRKKDRHAASETRLQTIPTRRSARLADKPTPDYTADSFEDAVTRPLTHQRGPTANHDSSSHDSAIGLRDHEAERKAFALKETVDKCRASMDALKAKLQIRVLHPLGESSVTLDGKKDDVYRQESARLWGQAVLKLGDVADWRVYYESRMARPYAKLPSPYALLQESYASDMWHLLVACVLMSRVSSAAIKEKCLGGFFQAYPTPSAALCADPDDVLSIIKPLGLFPSRMSAIVDITEKFLTMPEFRVSLQPPFKLKGVGQFGLDSFRLFCLDDLSCNPEDRNLRAYASWRKAQAVEAPTAEDQALVVKQEQDAS